MLLNKKVYEVIKLLETEPDLFFIFGETEDDINNWRNLTKEIIYIIQDKASMEISVRKASVQFGFQKLKYPIFQGEILNYQEFKKRWVTK